MQGSDLLVSLDLTLMILREEEQIKERERWRDERVLLECYIIEERMLKTFKRPDYVTTCVTQL